MANKASTTNEQEIDFLGSNIKLLREEARLSIEEFAERAGVSVETVKAWENGTLRPYTKELMVICPILRIHEDDLLERNLVEERQSAYKRMKHGSDRKNFDWYYGSRSKLIFYLLPVILIPVIFILSFLIFTPIMEETKIYLNANGLEIPFDIEYMNIIWAYIASSICGGVFMIIELIKRYRQYIRPWYIILAISFSMIVFTVICLALLPFYGYCVYQVFVKRGKN